jgi:hypothetical protein
MKSKDPTKYHSNFSKVMSNQKMIKKQKQKAKKKIHEKEKEKLDADVKAYLESGGEIDILVSGQNFPSRKALNDIT